MYGPTTVVWKYRTGAQDSYVCYCILDARKLWDSLNATGITMLSSRP